MLKLKDAYINNSIFFDVLFAGIIVGVNFIPGLFTFHINDKKDNIDILSDIISASISLAGFILAALTIIVSMRSNIGNKPENQVRSPMELFFSDANYSKVLSAFQIAIVELTSIFILSYVIWISVANVDNELLFSILLALFFMIGSCVIRTLSILFMIINIDRPNLS